MNINEIVEIRQNHIKIKGSFKIANIQLPRREHHERLLNVYFEWDSEHLSDETPLEGPPIQITIDMVKKVIFKMKFGKAACPSGVVIEIIRAAGDARATMVRDPAIAIIRDGKVPAEWGQSFIVCLYKKKRDVLWTETTTED